MNDAAQSVGERSGPDDQARVRLALKATHGAVPSRQALAAAARRFRASGNLPSMVQLSLLVGGLPSQIQSLGDDLSERLPNLVLFLDGCKAGDSQHPYYRQTWWSVLSVHQQTRLSALRRVVECLKSHDLTLTPEALCVVAGAPLAHVPQFEETLKASRYSPHSGEFALDAESGMKHRLNELIIQCWSKGRPINIFEGCQGAGDGTKSYQDFGAVVAAEINEKTFGQAVERVAHAHLDLGSSVRPGTSALDRLESLGLASPPYAALMPTSAMDANRLAKRLCEWSWEFEWIDLDAYGMIETSNIGLSEILCVAANTAIVAISNGISWQRRFMANIELENRAIALLTAGSNFYSAAQRRDQRDLLFDHVLEVEASRRAKQVLDMGHELHPLVMYDGRTSKGGIQRGYYLFIRSPVQMQQQRLKASFGFRRDLKLEGIRLNYLTHLGTSDPSPTKVLMASFSDVSDGERVKPGAASVIRSYLDARIGMLTEGRVPSWLN